MQVNSDQPLLDCGSLTIVGTGIMLGAHLSPRARTIIAQADIVFAAVTDGICELWLQQINTNVHSFAPLYAEGKSRHLTYQAMIEMMLSEVRRGNKVVGAFYGHPGIFAYAPHKAIELARAEGFSAQMEPAISATDCLYADLGIDPGRVGCQYYETSQFMFYQRQIDPSAYLILWQVALAGDQTIARMSSCQAYLQVLVELLTPHYPNHHLVFLYEAAAMPFMQPRIEKIALSDLPEARLSLSTTLVVPPARKLIKNQAVLERLTAIAATL